ncbi:PREDICTED: protein p13 MTCP-1-like [Myotis davidii]|uniref:protein p13 MTCP-1-like n=1 Tax=Myotis davidii TaxID=225400 RepID=UPI0007677099|nr:PREDICTED: protein p13 MTCP-1-like [Myotis davidii]
MANLPVKVHLTSHPYCLRIRGHAVYEDEDQRTWLHLVVDTVGVLQILLHQEYIPSEDIEVTNSPLTSIIMPWMWRLNPVGQYVDPMCRFWRIVHHVKENGVEEMILELRANT